MLAVEWLGARTATATQVIALLVNALVTQEQDPTGT